ncbi:hypothetical protein AB4Z30_02245 [Paenibacillus sp. 2TAF8]|jgi:hypothetical protein|uniref:hypothetical protein n=1 Tax=Paenibacillus sp. 2TAF8 TaxID=3233020 RepID=UPI003F9AFAD5
MNLEFREKTLLFFLLEAKYNDLEFRNEQVYQEIEDLYFKFKNELESEYGIDWREI